MSEADESGSLGDLAALTPLRTSVTTYRAGAQAPVALLGTEVNLH